MLILDTSACFRDSTDAVHVAPPHHCSGKAPEAGVHDRKPHLCQLCVGIHNGAELHSLQLLNAIRMIPWACRGRNPSGFPTDWWGCCARRGGTPGCCEYNPRKGYNLTMLLRLPGIAGSILTAPAVPGPSMMQFLPCRCHHSCSYGMYCSCNFAIQSEQAWALLLPAAPSNEPKLMPPVKAKGSQPEVAAEYWLCQVLQHAAQQAH